MDGIVISGFGGIGKTELAKKYENVIDLESILWKWKYQEKIEQKNLEHYKSYDKRVPNPDYPNNYIKEIKKNLKKFDIVLVAYSTIIYEELVKNKIDFYLCYPEEDAKEIYLERYKKRGNNKKFIQNCLDYYEKAISEIKQKEAQKIVLQGSETLEDYCKKNNWKLKKKD